MFGKNNITEENKTFFKSGDIVILRHEALLNRVPMLVKEKVSRQMKDSEGNVENFFVGMRCQWLDKNSVLQEAVFSTKDLEFHKK